MEPLWIGIAFILGFITRQLGLPSLVGFLAAGFILPLPPFNAQYSETLQEFADFGVTLMLFSIGLKLQIGTLAKPIIWATSLLHMALIVGVFTPLLMLLGVLDLPYCEDLDVVHCSPDRLCSFV